MKPNFALHSYPWYVADWRESETRIDMTAEERGLFREAMDYCYREGSLPNDRRKLIAILACTEEEFERSFPAVERLFTKAEGRLEHHRVSRVLRELEGYREQKRNAGEASGLSRRNKKAKTNEHPFNDRSNGKGTNVEPTSTSTSTSTTATPALAKPAESASGFEEFWTAYPNKIGKDQACRAWVSIVTEDLIPEIKAALNRWLKSDQWTKDNGRYIQAPAKWLQDRNWLNFPRPAVVERPEPKASSAGIDPNAEWVAPWKVKKDEVA